LTAEEVREIRQHPVLGAELVEDVEFLSALVPIIRHHHERFDGAGYPDGLAGEQIPVLSRILAAADCYDAMTSDRAYRPRLSGEAALLEMERVAGSQLDADCVERLANLVREEPGVAS
jgi:HD-GYP domain-containing protein (c-di-GMP phosphodiesterase class II)